MGSPEMKLENLPATSVIPLSPIGLVACPSIELISEPLATSCVNTNFLGVASYAEKLQEFAGRACYKSFNNKKNSTNQEYLKHILDVKHESVLEHAHVSLYIQGVSRSLTHELIRHRIANVSQESQRYVDKSDTAFVIPPIFIKYATDNNVSLASLPIFKEWVLLNQEALDGYNKLVKMAQDLEIVADSKTTARKRIRESCRSVLPNDTETSLVFTANLREWRHIIRLRASIYADLEIRRLAVMIFDILHNGFPNNFQDMKLEIAEDGLYHVATISKNV